MWDWEAVGGGLSLRRRSRGGFCAICFENVCLVLKRVAGVGHTQLVELNCKTGLFGLFARRNGALRLWFRTLSKLKAGVYSF